MKLKLKEIVENFLPAAEFCNFEPLSGGVSSDVFLIEVRLENRLEKMVLKIEGGPAGENDIKKKPNWNINTLAITTALGLSPDARGAKIG